MPSNDMIVNVASQNEYCQSISNFLKLLLLL